MTELGQSSRDVVAPAQRPRLIWLALAAGLAYSMTALTIVGVLVAWSDSRRHIRLTFPSSVLGGPSDGSSLTITEPNDAGQELLFAGIYFVVALVSGLVVLRLCSDYNRTWRSRRLGLLLALPCALILGPAVGLFIGWIAYGTF